MCISSFMAAEFEDLPDQVSKEVKAFADVNVKWLADVLADSKWSDTKSCERRARTI
ncbi:hypothetical protein Pta6605_15350 [Pseudomonas amygdali pv. tabaci]|nr:hypothetical protein Pta6605_15350 [Pseudomonas amygdali pv. tabaci]